MTLASRVLRFITEERPAGVILSVPEVTALAISATEFYAGYAEILSIPGVVDENTVLSLSEWAIIRPLFLLYVERETALQLEASRGLGVDVFGRTSSEVAADIALLEAKIPKDAFFQGIRQV